MAVLRKKVLARMDTSQQSTTVEKIPEGSLSREIQSEDGTRPTNQETSLADETKGLTIQTTSQTSKFGLTDQTYSEDFVQSPTSTTTSNGFFQSPLSAMSGDAFYQAPTATTPSDAFFQTPATSMTSDDFVQTPTSATSSADSPTADRSRWKTAIEDARIFAGGLIRHPFESTKHFTILRHSHGLVYYKGPDTSIAITIFSDKPLTSDRRLWLQMKGWTGKTGMRAKALLRTNGSWINVTPSTQVEAAHLPPMDERAWKRDIRKFLDKAPKQLRKHAVRETCVLRVPFEAVDGYFRVVLTGADTRVSLCPSPVFRVASTSMSASSIKGASLSTLPVELGIKILQYTAVQAASNAVVPFGNTIRSQVAPYMPNFWIQEATSTADDMSGVQDRFDAANGQFERSREISTNSTEPRPYVSLDRLNIIGDPSGPEPPFPIRLDSKIIRGTGKSTSTFGMPTANLASIADDLIAMLSGTYFGWALIKPKSKETEEMHLDWRHAIIFVAPCSWSSPAVAPKKVIKAYLIHDFNGEQFFDAKISLVVMGYLRPFIPYSETEAFFYETCKDVSITQASLDREREEWGPEASLERIKSAKSERSISERYVDARKLGQR